MTWKWNHNQKALDIFRNTVDAWETSRKIEICSEWSAFYQQRGYDDYEEDDPNYFNEVVYESSLSFWGNQNEDTLTDAIVASAEAHAVCDNGGFDLWACPYGCHRVKLP